MLNTIPREKLQGVALFRMAPKLERVYPEFEMSDLSSHLRMSI
jgi:hypothetical protein